MGSVREDRGPGMRLPNVAGVAGGGPRCCPRGGKEMGVRYYDELLPIREAGTGLPGV